MGIVSQAKVQKCFEAYGTGIRLEWSRKVPPRRYELRVSRISRSLQRRFESRAAKAVTLGALGRAQSKEKRENTICFPGWHMPTLAFNRAQKKF
jgi:hypothetical protein